MWRKVRGMIKKKKERGKDELKSMKEFEGCNNKYERRKRMVVKNDMRIMCMKKGRK
jgi:ribosomal protein L13